jgi:hypothetical protein
VSILLFKWFVFISEYELMMFQPTSKQTAVTVVEPKSSTPIGKKSRMSKRDISHESFGETSYLARMQERVKQEEVCFYGTIFF